MKTKAVTIRNADADAQSRRVRPVVLLAAFVLGITPVFWLWTNRFQAKAIAPRFTNHRDQLAYMLAQHGLSVSSVRLDRAWPDRINSQTYGANITVVLSDAVNAKMALGRIECRVEKRKCWYRLASLGIDMEELPDLAPFIPTPVLPATIAVTATPRDLMQAGIEEVSSCLAPRTAPRAASTPQTTVAEDVQSALNCLTSDVHFPRMIKP
jgi:hypothetical protein